MLEAIGGIPHSSFLTLALFLYSGCKSNPVNAPWWLEEFKEQEDKPQGCFHSFPPAGFPDCPHPRHLSFQCLTSSPDFWGRNYGGYLRSPFPILCTVEVSSRTQHASTYTPSPSISSQLLPFSLLIISLVSPLFLFLGWTYSFYYDSFQSTLGQNYLNLVVYLHTTHAAGYTTSYTAAEETSSPLLVTGMVISRQLI